jgi:methyl-accepting chemotaxis protein
MQVIAVPQTLFLIFTIAVVVCVIVQAGVFLGFFLIARAAAAKAEKLSAELSGKALPILFQVRGIVEDLSPKLKVISANLVEISNTLKDQTRHVNTTVGEVVDKTRHQADRVDEMVSAILDGVTHAGATIQAGVSKPVRQVNGILQGLRAGFETFFAKGKPASAYRNGTVAEEVRVREAERVDF